MPSALQVLLDPAYQVVPVPTGDMGVAWLRSHVARFSEGEEHRRRRRIATDLVAGVVGRVDRLSDPLPALAAALGFPALAHAAADAAVIGTAYQPHLPVTAAADAAVERLVAVCGARNETVAARISLLVQAQALTALVDFTRRGDGGPPVPTTRRVAPDGTLVEVDLSTAPFGLGRHACPGRDLALTLASAACR